jgi:hypothetical protein
MGIGHLAVGFAAKRWAPRLSLGVLLLAAVLPDVLWGILLLAGVEHARIVPGIAAIPLQLYDYPISHSLVTTAGWAAVFAMAVFAVTRSARGALVVALAVLSHWALDAFSHLADMPVLPHGPYVGLGLWRSQGASVLIEMAFLTMGLASYVGATRPTSAGGAWGLTVLTVLFFASNLLAYFGPPPPSVKAIAVGNLILLLVLWAAHGVDRRRAAAPVTARP